MSGFRDMVAADNKSVFLKVDEFAETRTVIYDGVTYTGIPIVITGLKEQARRQLEGDHAQGLYRATSVMHCALDDLDGHQPEKGTRIRIQDDEGGVYYREYYIATSVCQMGMLRVELEAIEE